MRYRLGRWGVALLVLAALALGMRDVRGDATHGWYLSGGAGLDRLDTETGYDPPPDLGVRVVAGAGFQLNRNLALELDTGYIRNTNARF